ncbi:MAG TPA: hypothetical protein VMR33_16785 [Candidatus Baltobacteraceae bacterium]|jgi:hypothetical protein|nr:hypothetical protein [Candidatus Baltobacteraceae bacterium]
MTTPPAPERKDLPITGKFYEFPLVVNGVEYPPVGVMVGRLLTDDEHRLIQRLLSELLPQKHGAAIGPFHLKGVDLAEELWAVELSVNPESDLEIFQEFLRRQFPEAPRAEVSSQ